MKVKLKLLAILALIAQLTYSQNDWPKKILIGKDTLVAITIPQVKQMNMAFADLDFYKQLSDTFRLLNKYQEMTINKQGQIVSNYDSQLSLKQSVINNDQQVIFNFKELDKANNKKISWLKLQRNGLLIISVATLAKIFLFK